MNETIATEKEQAEFIKKLRENTAESHQQLEENPLSKALLAPEVTLTDYQLYLSRMYGVTVACEKNIFPFLENFVDDLEKRRKTSLLVNDLRATGLTDRQIADIQVPDLNANSLAEALGVTYVVEGSSLGGRVIYKHIHQKLGLTENAGASYFGGYGGETGSMWKSFMTGLSGYAATSGESDVIIEGAKKTFSIIDSWL
jgi:heme oxygenase (biliverdin-IX-beta and delta-forming)